MPKATQLVCDESGFEPRQPGSGVCVCNRCAAATALPLEIMHGAALPKATDPAPCKSMIQHMPKKQRPRRARGSTGLWARLASVPAQSPQTTHPKADSGWANQNHQDRPRHAQTQLTKPELGAPERMLLPHQESSVENGAGARQGQGLMAIPATRPACGPPRFLESHEAARPTRFHARLRACFPAASWALNLCDQEETLVCTSSL